MTNELKRRLNSGESAFGVWSMIPSPMVANVIASAGVDFVIADREHGPFSLESLETFIYAVEAEGVSAVVRVAASSEEDILSVLEVGTRSLMMSHVTGPEQASGLVRACMYPPIGTRGLSPFTRAHGYSEERIASKMAERNEDTLVGALVEGSQALALLPEIASIDGVDLVYLGLYDIASSMGRPGDLAHPDVIEVLKRSVAIIEDAGKAAGTVARDTSSLEYYAALGFRFLAYRNDTSMLQEAVSAGVSAFRRLPSQG